MAKHKRRPDGLNRIQLLRWIKSNRTEFVEAPYEGMDDCWMFTGAKSGGYGHLLFEGKDQYVHRLSLAEKLKRELGPEEETRHMCEPYGDSKDKSYRACFNPRHLVAGSKRDNMQDSKDRDRGNIGEAHGQSKLNDFKAKRIRQLHGTGDYTYTELGRRFGVSESTVRSLINGKTWRHVL